MKAWKASSWKRKRHQSEKHQKNTASIARREKIIEMKMKSKSAWRKMISIISRKVINESAEAIFRENNRRHQISGYRKKWSIGYISVKNNHREATPKWKKHARGWPHQRRSSVKRPSKKKKRSIEMATENLHDISLYSWSARENHGISNQQSIVINRNEEMSGAKEAWSSEKKKYYIESFLLRQIIGSLEENIFEKWRRINTASAK